MAEAGWQIGEPKWQDIRPAGQSRWLIRDLRKHFDTRTGRVVGIDLQEYNLSLAAGGRLRLHTGSLPMFPVQSWKRIASLSQKKIHFELNSSTARGRVFPDEPSRTACS
jgi:hypothetical protein